MPTRAEIRKANYQRLLSLGYSAKEARKYRDISSKRRVNLKTHYVTERQIKSGNVSRSVWRYWTKNKGEKMPRSVSLQAERINIDAGLSNPSNSFGYRIMWHILVKGESETQATLAVESKPS